MIHCKYKIFEKLCFKDDCDIEKFNNYLELKGKFLHKHVYDCFMEYQSSVNYTELSGYIKYDKGIRNTLYKYLSVLEEYHRAKLIDNFDVKFDVEINTKKLKGEI